MTKVTNISVFPDGTPNFVKNFKRRRQNQKLGSLEKQLLVAVIVLVIAFITFLVLFLLSEYYYNQLAKEKVCTSKECIESAMALLQSVDLSQDPCEDFYKFACGNFEDDHPLPENYLHNSWFVEKENRLNRLILNILKSPTSPSDLKSVRQTKEFFQSCTNRSELNSLGLTPLFEILELLELPRSVPTNKTTGGFNLGRTLALAQRHLSEDIMIALSITKDNSNSSGETARNSTILKLSPGANDFNVFDIWRSGNDIFSSKRFLKFLRKREDKKRTSNGNQSSKQVVKATIQFIASIIGEIFSSLDLDEDISNDNTTHHHVTTAYKIVTFTSQLIKDVDSNKNATTNETENTMASEPMTFSTLQMIMDQETNNSFSSNRIDWREYISTLFENVNTTYDVDFEPIIVENLEYFKHISKILADAKPETIQRHIWWKIVEQYAKFTTSEIRAIYFRYYQALFGENVSSSRTQTCTNLMKNTMNIALSYEMTRINNFSTTIQKVHEMLIDIEKAFEILVQSMTWMDRQSKAITLDKAKSVSNEIGYAAWLSDPEKIDKHYEGLDLKKSEFLMNIKRISQWEVQKVLLLIGPYKENSSDNSLWFVNPLQVNAYYSRDENSIIIPAGILQTPFYFRGLESLNYGAIGTILGHELTHGFDIEGKNYNKFGKRQENWWPYNIITKYEEKTQCFIEQYENYTLYGDNKLNGSFTLAENIADNGGIRESYEAYQLYKVRHGQELKLPGFENFTHEQLLFLSYANIWCEVTTPKYYMLSQDSHSPQRVRVLASLQNMKEFSKVYNCPKNSFMNPDNKCIIWYEVFFFLQLVSCRILKYTFCIQ